VVLLTRIGEPEPGVAEELGPIEVERRVPAGIRVALLGLLVADRRRKPGRELIEAIKTAAARRGADGVVDVQLDSRTEHGTLVLRLRGRAVRRTEERPG
jgi:hypothetical protein